MAKDFLVKTFSTFFFVGYLPLAPGSMASLLGVGLSYVLSQHIVGYVCAFLFFIIGGFFVCGRMEELQHKKDPSCVVLDEVVGTMIAFFLLPFYPAVIITAFFVFRAFDMFKIYPTDQLEKWKGGWGIVADDIMAGVYTNLVMHAALRLKLLF